jgi:acylphosphatase
MQLSEGQFYEEIWIETGNGNNQIVQRTHIMESMKLKIKITGHNVHKVGYRYFLMSSAIDLSLRGFHARNMMSGEEQEVVVLVEGDEEAIADLKKLIESQKPEHSLVSNIAFEDYDSDVMRTGDYAQVCTALQLNKAIPLLLDMRDDLKAVRKTTDSTLDEIKAVRKTTDSTLDEIKAVRKTTDSTLDEIKAVRKTTDSTLDEIKAVRKTTDSTLDEIKAVRKTTDSTLDEIKAVRGSTETTLEEIKGLREDIQPGYARQVREDIRAIKERLGMT